MTIHSIRNRLGVTQAALAAGLGVTQGNISHYERGQTTIPPSVAARLIDFASTLGVSLTFDDIYRLDAALTQEKEATHA